MATPKPRNCYSPRKSVISPAGHTPAQQQFKDDCNINTIMARFQKTGLVDHISNHQLEYGFATPMQYHESMNIITHADSMFNELPSNIRNKFNNNPQAFLEFVQDPKNAEEAQKLGIALSTTAAEKAAELSGTAKPDESVDSTQEAGVSTEDESPQ